MSMFQEPDGKTSATRVVGTVIIAAVVIVMLRAAIVAEWETARTLAMELLLLAGALYGINRGFAKKDEPPQP